MPRPAPQDDPTPSQWRLAPAPLVPGGDLPAAAVLREAGPLAGPLWHCLRLVTRWAAAPAPQRDTALAPGAGPALAQEVRSAGLPAEARGPALTLATQLTEPLDANAGCMAEACHALAHWASAAYMPTAAAEFAAAAAATLPDSARHARGAGDYYRRAGRHAEASAMYGRAVVLARQAGDWDAYAASHAALGRVAQLRGDLAGARRSLERALRRATRPEQAELRARVMHELFRLERRTGNPGAAEVRGAEAAAEYPAGHPALRELAAEAVSGWLDEERHEDAYPVLAHLATHGRGLERTRALGWLAHTAAILGEREAARGALRALLAVPRAEDGRAQALLEAAEGALLLGWIEGCERAARAALGSAADHRDEPATVSAAHSLLTRAAARRAMGPVAPPQPRDGVRSALSQALVAALDASPPSG